MAKRCDYKGSMTDAACSAEATWIADVGWTKEPGGAAAPSYEGTSWSVSLCEAHYELLRSSDRITGTAHRVGDR